MRIAVSEFTSTPAGVAYKARPGKNGSKNWLLDLFSPDLRSLFDRLI